MATENTAAPPISNDSEIVTDRDSQTSKAPPSATAVKAPSHCEMPVGKDGNTSQVSTNTVAANAPHHNVHVVDKSHAVQKASQNLTAPHQQEENPSQMKSVQDTIKQLQDTIASLETRLQAAEAGIKQKANVDDGSLSSNLQVDSERKLENNGKAQKTSDVDGDSKIDDKDDKDDDEKNGKADDEDVEPLETFDERAARYDRNLELQIKTFPASWLHVNSSSMSQEMSDLRYERMRDDLSQKSSVIIAAIAPKGYGSGSSATSQSDSNDDDEKVAYRIWIQSYELFKYLKSLCSERGKLNFRKKHSMLRPFKLLIANESQIRKDLDAMMKNEELNAYAASLQVSINDAKQDAPDSVSDTAIENRTSRIDQNSQADSKDKVSEDERAMLDAKLMLRNHIQVLKDFMDIHMKDIFNLRNQVMRGELVDVLFEDLWHLFQPGRMVLAPSGAEQNIRAYKVLQAVGGRSMMLPNGTYPEDLEAKTYDQVPETEPASLEANRKLSRNTKMTPVVVDCCFIDYNGSWYGASSVRFVISQYHGHKAIKELPLWPLSCHPESDDICAALVKRGNKFINCIATPHVQYSGRNMPLAHAKDYDNRNSGSGTSVREMRICSDIQEVNCECIIDSHMSRGSLKFGGGLLNTPTETDDREFQESRLCDCAMCSVDHEICDSFVDRDARDNYINGADAKRILESDFSGEELDDELKMMLPLRLYGYALADRTWHALNVVHCELVEHKDADKAFDDLVLDSTHKDIIQALVANQVKTYKSNPNDAAGSLGQTKRTQSLDLIRGKGQGLVILLHGVPGVGKTSTAEAVALQLKRPLFPITCGDLGSEPSVVEAHLDEYFKLAHRWGCVLLLDEADVFLATRSAGDHVRNGLVSVFLRALEYYAGVLILTTNRVGEIDEAFRSRVHVSLRYDPLDERTTKAIWDINLRRLEENEEYDIDINKEEIVAFYKELWDASEDFPGKRWNGRQIKNAFQTAVAMANWRFYQKDETERQGKKPVLKASQFRFVAGISDAFDDYLSAVHKNKNKKESAFTYKARQNQTREDSFGTPEYQANNKLVNSPGISRATNMTEGAKNQDPKQDKLREIRELEETLATVSEMPQSEQKAAREFDIELKLRILRKETGIAVNGVKAHGDVTQDDDW